MTVFSDALAKRVREIVRDYLGLSADSRPGHVTFLCAADTKPEESTLTIRAMTLDPTINSYGMCGLLATFDSVGNPIMGTGNVGGLGIFGDNLGAGGVFHNTHIDGTNNRFCFDGPHGGVDKGCGRGISMRSGVGPPSVEPYDEWGDLYFVRVEVSPVPMPAVVPAPPSAPAPAPAPVATPGAWLYRFERGAWVGKL